jgi:hypothetical protein
MTVKITEHEFVEWLRVYLKVPTNGKIEWSDELEEIYTQLGFVA